MTPLTITELMIHTVILFLIVCINFNYKVLGDRLPPNYGSMVRSTGDTDAASTPGERRDVHDNRDGAAVIGILISLK